MAATATTHPWAVDVVGRVPLHVAAEGGHLEVCELLLKAMTKTPPPPPQTNKDATDGAIANAMLGGGGAAAIAPLGPRAPTDLSGFTPVAYASRAAAKLERKKKLTEEGRARYGAVKRLLFRRGDPSVLPMLEPDCKVCGGGYFVEGDDPEGDDDVWAPAFGVGEAPGWRRDWPR